MRGGGDVNDRLRVTNASAGIHVASRLGRGDRCAHELGLKLRPTPLGKWVQEAGVTATPRYERDLVHGCDKDWPARLFEDHMSNGAGKACEAIHEGCAPDV